MKVAVLTKTKTDTVRKIDVADSVFATEVAESLLAQAVRTQLANRRLSPTHTKKRGEVSGGGAKPWRQKGTGRARVGSSRSPIWRGGGITFGPTGEINHSLKMGKTMRRSALLGALTAQWKAEKVSIISDVKLTKPSTKALAKNLTDLGLETSGSTLVIAENDEVIFRSGDNLPAFEVVSASYLSVYQILSSRRVIFTESGLKVFSDLFGVVK
jgi:large subunit ribosomal protein L4